MASIAIILLNFNSTRLTKKCVKSVLATKDEQDVYHIILWDNDSNDAPKSEEFPYCDLIHSKKNLGFALGNNKAVDYAVQKYHPDYLLILNNDTRLTKGMVRQLVETMESSKEIGMVVPKIYFEKGYEFHKNSYDTAKRGKVLWYAGGGIDWRNLIMFHKGVDEVDRGQFDIETTSLPARLSLKGIKKKLEEMLFEEAHLPELVGSSQAKVSFYDTRFATGCCFLISPKLWKKLKGFDAKFFMYYEDVDLSYRLSKLKKRIVFEPRAVLFHLNAGSSGGSGSGLHLYYQTRNRLRFGLKYATLKSKLLLLLEAKRQFSSGTEAARLGILHALEGRWGNQTHNIPQKKQLPVS